MNRVTLFTSSVLALPLLYHLKNRGILACLVLSQQNDGEILMQNIAHLQTPYFFYDEKSEATNLQILQQLQSDGALIFTFSHKLPQSTLEHFSHNVYNLHASPLPKYRGAQPLFWQLRNGEARSALSLHHATQTFDSGDILVQREFAIHPKDTHGILNGIVSELAIEVVEAFLSKKESLKAIAQTSTPSYAPRIKQKDSAIDWAQMRGEEIFNLVRACNPFAGGAKTLWKGIYLSIFEVSIVDAPNFGLKAGTILHIGAPEGLIVATKDGAIRFDVLATMDGYFSGVNFANRFGMDAGEVFA